MTINYDKNIKGLYNVNTTSSPLNLRSQPSTESTIVCELPKNSRVICLGNYSGDFYFVLYSPDDTIKSGFAHKNYLKKEVTLT